MKQYCYRHNIQRENHIQIVALLSCLLLLIPSQPVIMFHKTTSEAGLHVKRSVGLSVGT